ncbi:chemotaxis protein CheW (plasmid) [Phormidium sp. CLA17]|uniref:chemotaxis protein CheW n=1 Tax=Leptolyngbya sp. Cla-17 TaxID=2803751 RepID=UPI001492FF9F|nr:chemotaxis protein CheW [Leptolyngbya sp. Cla-17]MBM0745596.1 chemotaxis protein CheW [Leptolyngbya sp. Cla-17]
MLMLLFCLENERYALESKQIVEIVPLVEIKKLPHAPDYISGVFNYRGQIVPILDLCQLIQGRPCHTHLSTRIILVNYFHTLTPEKATAETAATNLLLESQNRAEVTSKQPVSILGLMAEQVVETLNKPEAEFVDAGVSVKTAPYLGKMIMDAQGMIQCVRIEYLLPEAERSTLFATHDIPGN